MSYNFLDYTLDENKAQFKEWGEKPFRAIQVYKWVYQKNVLDLDLMTDLSKDFRENFREKIIFKRPEVTQHLVSKDGTEKFLFDVGDKLTIEAVMIPNEDRKTLCVSSEVGCNLGCKFCYTGKFKLKKRLTASEIVGQFQVVNEKLAERGMTPLTNIVYMGMGEPLDNPSEVMKSIQIIHSPEGLNFSKKRITVSTSGIVPLIPLVTASGVRLAVSLNASNDKVRSEIMPINKKYNIAELFEACEVHSQESRDPVTFEYVLLKGVTDQLEHARELAGLLQNKSVMINLIPFNEHPGSGYEKPDSERVTEFQNYLLRKKIRVYVRKTRGEDIFAACGQLANVGSSQNELNGCEKT